MSEPTAVTVALGVEYPTDGTCHVCRKAIGYWDQRAVNDCTTCELATCSLPSCLAECDYGGGDEGLGLTEWLCVLCKTTDERKPERNYFDDYEERHAAMALLWEAYANPECPRRLRLRIVNAIAYLRTQAMAVIPYSATERNHTWDGKRV